MLNEQQLDGAMASSFLFWCVFSQLCVCVCVVCVDELGAQQEVCVGTGKKRHTSADPLIFALTADERSYSSLYLSLW